MSAGDAVLPLSGDIDHRVVGSVYDRAAALLGPDVDRLVIDASRTAFLDSTGIGLLVRLKSLAELDGCAVVLRNPNSRVLRTLAVAGMADYLPTETV